MEQIMFWLLGGAVIATLVGWWLLLLNYLK